jgi:ABC-type multidrug transport system ATPase subunit
MPPRWSVREYVEWSARLSGVPSSPASALARVAIERLELGPLATTELARLVPHAARATLVAAALATSAEIVALEDPLGALADEVAAGFATILAAAIADRSWLVFAPRVPFTSALALAADEVLIASGGRIVAQGSPAEVARQDRRFVGRLHGDPAAIGPALAARGARLEEHGSHLLFDLGDALTTSELFAICASRDVVLLELLPVARALA